MEQRHLSTGSRLGQYSFEKRTRFEIKEKKALVVDSPGEVPVVVTSNGSCGS